MEKDVLKRLCFELEEKYGLRASNHVSSLEKVCIFPYTIALDVSNRDDSERFQCSGETICRCMHEVLNSTTGRYQGYKRISIYDLEF
ncbi:hypothetical protein V2J09_013239 [Rumex salicifolius]